MVNLEGKVLKPSANKNLVNAKDFTTIAYTFWQIMVSNVLLQGGHLNGVCIFSIYVIWMFVSQRMINLSILILNHVFRYMNKESVGLPFV